MCASATPKYEPLSLYLNHHTNVYFISISMLHRKRLYI